MAPTAILVGCVAGKFATPLPARDLYTSPLFRRRRAYAEASGLPWAILSAEHGLLHPEMVIAPYEHQLKRPEIAAWSGRLRRQLPAWLGEKLDGATIEVHAGVHYVDGVRRAQAYLERFEDVTYSVAAPLAGLGIGQQLRWYAQRADGVISAAIAELAQALRRRGEALGGAHAERAKAAVGAIVGNGFSVRFVDYCEDARTPGLLGQIRGVTDWERAEVKVSLKANPTLVEMADCLEHELRHVVEPDWDCGQRDVLGRGHRA